MEQNEIDKYVKSFINSIKKAPLSQKENRNFSQQDIYKNAVYQGYLDASRTFTRISEIGTDNRDKVFEEVAEKISEFFKNEEDASEEVFDEKHKCFCDCLINKFKEKQYTITYGKAQKIVNMAFKYLYCCEGAKNKEKLFKFCHMTLDTYTLNWVKKNTSIKRTKEWSKLDKEEYLDIQKAIRKTINENGNLKKYTVLQNEFIIWPDEMLLEALYDAKKALNSAKSINSHQNNEMKSIINEIKTILCETIEKYK